LNLNKTVTFFGVLILLLFTYFRENFLLEINASLASETFDRSSTYWLADYFQNMPQNLLLKWKWGLTIFFSLNMPLITIGSLYYWFKSKEVLKLSAGIFSVLFLIVGIVASFGFLMNSFNAIYFVLRIIIGLLQSPIPFFTLFVLFYWMCSMKYDKL